MAEAQGFLCPLGVPRNATELVRQYRDLLDEFDFKNPRKVCKKLVGDGLITSFKYQRVLPSKMTALVAVDYLGITWGTWNSFAYDSCRGRRKKNKGRRKKKGLHFPPRAKFFPMPISGTNYFSIHATYARDDIFNVEAHWEEIFRGERGRPIINGVEAAFEKHLRQALGKYRVNQTDMVWPPGLPRTNEELYQQYGAGSSSYMHTVLRCSKFVGSRHVFQELMQDIWMRILQAHILHRFASAIASNGRMTDDPEQVAKCFRAYLKAAMLRHFANWVRDRKRHFNSEYLQDPDEEGNPWEDQITVAFPGADLCEDYGPEEVAEFVRLLDHHGHNLNPHVEAGSVEAQEEGARTETLLENVLTAVEQGYTLSEAVRVAAQVNDHKQMRQRLSRIRVRHG